MFGDVASALAEHGCNRPGEGGTFARIVVEKPFGRDLEQRPGPRRRPCTRRSTRTRSSASTTTWAKETVQNVLALRFGNAIFEPIWNRRYVDHIQITVAEELGVEHRGGFYETAGALRDIVQNHVMQVLALTLMEPPATVDAQGIRDEKVKLLRAVVIPDPDEAVINSVRGQYTAGVIDGDPVPGYREEEGVDPRSRTETFVAMRLAVDNWRWAGVPVYIRTGKRLPTRATEVRPAVPAGTAPGLREPLTRDLRPNMLLLRIQPDEGDLPVLRGQGPRRGVPAAVGGHGLQLRRRLPRRHGRGLRAAPARRHDRRRHPVHPHRRGRAGLADRRPLPRRRGARTACPCRSTRRGRGARRRPTLLLARDLRQWHEPGTWGCERPPPVAMPEWRRVR